MNKQTEESQPQRKIQVQKGEIFNHHSSCHKYIRIAQSNFLSGPGFRRFGEVRQGINSLDEWKENDKITNCGLLLKK